MFETILFGDCRDLLIIRSFPVFDKFQNVNELLFEFSNNQSSLVKNQSLFISE